MEIPEAALLYQGRSIALAAPGQLDSVALRIARPLAGTLVVEPTAGGRPLPRARAGIALDDVQPGWVTFPLGGPTGALPADGVRLSLRGAREGAGSISEVRLAISPTPAASPARLAVTYPLHGECVAGQAYVRGFVTSPSDGARSATLAVNGAPAGESFTRDGAFGVLVDPGAHGRRAPWSVTVAAKFPDGEELKRKVAIDACVAPAAVTPPSGPVADEGAPFGQIVRAGQAATLAFAGARLEIPAGAVTQDVRITIRPLTPEQVPALDDTMTNVTPDRRGYRLGPHGLKFAMPVRLLLPYDRQLLPAGSDDDEIGTMYFDEGAGAWQKVRSLADATGTVAAGTEHFTDFINARIAVPDHPTAASFDANTLKGVKMGDPGARITMIEPPQASPDGAAHLSYPIDLPPGRAGLTPKVELTYNSDAVNQNSWVGAGWNLEVPYIEVDTRFGVPQYDPNFETETYLLNGEQLSPTANRLTPVGRTDDKHFFRRVEGKFEQIIRTGTSPNAYSWTVVDKNGTQYLYGISVESQVSLGSGNPIFRWYLSSVRDTFGNLLTYSYFHDQGMLGGEPWVQVYPSSIDYGAHLNEIGPDTVDLPAHYHVKFVLEPQGFFGTEVDRPDAFSTGRPGFLVRTRQKLKRIDVMFDTTEILSYFMDYTSGPETFGKALLDRITVGIPGDEVEGGFPVPQPIFYEHSFTYFPANPSFGAPVDWGSIGRAGGLSPSNDGTLYLSHFAGYDFPECDPHFGVGGSSTVSFGSDTAWFLADGNFDKTTGGFMDVNGDGLPDAFGGGSTFLGTVTGGRFSSGFDPVSDLLSSSDRTQRGLSTGGHFFEDRAHAEAEYNWGHTGETQTMADMNGDGLPDLARLNGVVQVETNTGSGIPSFNSGTTPSSWGGFSLATLDLTNPDEKVKLTALLHADPMLRWTAPLDGVVNVGGAVQKLVDGGAGSDGVTLLIFHSHSQTGSGTPVDDPLWARNFAHDDLAPCVPVLQPAGSCSPTSTPFTLQVKAGDVLTFLADSNNTTVGDTVAWSPHISYVSLVNSFGNEFDITPAQHQELEPWGAPVYDFDQAADFPRTAGAPGAQWVAPAPGTVQIDANFEKELSPDDVQVRVIKNKGLSSQQIVYPVVQPGATRTFPVRANTTTGGTISLPTDVQKGDTLTFSVSSDTPINPNVIHQFFTDWAPRVTYTTLCRQIPGSIDTTDVSVNNPQYVCGTPNCQSTADGKTICPLLGGIDPLPNAPASADQIIQTVVPALETPVFDLLPNTDPGTTAATTVGMTATGDPVTFQLPFLSQHGQGVTVAVIQGPNKLYWKGRWVDGVEDDGLPDVANPPPTFTPLAGEKITFSLYRTSGVDTWAPGVTQGNQSISPHVNVRGPLTTPLLNGGYHGWTFAAWHGGTTFQSAKLVGIDSNVPTIANSDPSVWDQLTPNFGIPSGSGILEFPFWTEGEVNLTSGQMTPSREGLIGSFGGPVPDAFRMSRSTTTQALTSFVGSNSISGTDSNGQVEFMDLNGDRFPDSIGSGAILLNNGVNGFSQVSNAMAFSSSPDGNSYDNPRMVRSAQIGAGVGIGAPVDVANAKGETESISTVSLFSGVDYGYSTTKADMIDVNGDGLPDHVLMLAGASGAPPTMLVRLNLGYRANQGYRFSAEIPWIVPLWEKQSIASALSDGIDSFPNVVTNFILNEESSLLTSDSGALKLEDHGGNTLSGGVDLFGVGNTFGVARTYVDVVDINGDGLPDRVMKLPGEPGIRYQINTGEGFIGGFVPNASSDFFMNINADWGLTLEDSSAQGLGKNDALDFRETSSTNGTTGFSTDILTLFGCFVPETTTGGGTGHSQSELRFQDIDGDGKPDRILKLNSDDHVHAQLNAMGKANLLAGVKGPHGKLMVIDYKRQGNIVNRTAVTDPVTNRPQVVDMPENQWALASVTIADGQQNQITTTFDYFNSGRYDRQERENLGYSHVRTTRADGSHTDAFYRNQDYSLRHLPDVEIETDVSGNLWTKVTHGYDVRQMANSPVSQDGVVEVEFPAETSKTTSYYERQTSNSTGTQVQTAETRDYDTLGNLTSFVDMGDVATGTDDVFYKIGYDPILAKDLIFRANLVEARDAAAGAGNLLRQRTATYDSRGAFLTITNRLIGGRDPATPTVVHDGTQNPSMALSFDAFGNLQSYTDPTGYSVTYTYDAITQSFRTGSTDVFGLTSAAVPKYEWGTLSQVTDVNGQTEQFHFDQFGRVDYIYGPKDLDSARNPMGIPTIQFTYNPTTSLDNTGVLSSAKTQHKDASKGGAASTTTIDTYTFMDGFERVVQTKKMNEAVTAAGQDAAGFTVSGALIFDPMGRVSQRGQPVFVQTTGAGPESVQMLRPTMYHYDTLSRVIEVDTPDTFVTKTAYTVAMTPSLAGRTLFEKTVTDQVNNTRTEWRDGRQRILFVDEHNIIPPATTAKTLTTQYQYDHIDQLLTVVDAKNNTTSAGYDTLGDMVTLTSPDAGRTDYLYAALTGLVGAKETANLRAVSKLTKYTYQSGRLTLVDHPNDIDVAYTYGPKGAAGGQAGRIASITDESGVETRSYDELGNVSQMVRTPAPQVASGPKFPYTMKYAYDSFGRMLNMTYPDGEVVTYGYNVGGLPKTVTGKVGTTTTSYVSNILYTELEQRAQITLGDGSVTMYTYEPLMRRLLNVNTTAGGLTLQKNTYAYDAVGNVKSLQNAVAVPTTVATGAIAPGPTTMTYFYDNLYQLTSATGMYQGCASGCGTTKKNTLTMTYDEIGNIQRKIQNDVVVSAKGVSTTQTATSYDATYKYAGPRPHAATAFQTQALTYDADGNQLTSTGTFSVSRTLGWNDEDRLKSETDRGFTSTFLYDAEGNRTHKRRTTLETVYVNPYYVVKNWLTQTKHVMVGDSRVATTMATIKTAGQPSTAGAPVFFYYHPDHLQSTAFVTNQTGKLLQHDEYFASGEVWFQEALNADARNTQPYLFNAKELDETGFYYYGARHFDPRMSLWINSDPILASYMRGDGQVGGVYRPSSLAAYTYARNNPVVLRDPDGRESGEVSLIGLPGHEQDSPAGIGRPSRPITVEEVAGTAGFAAFFGLALFAPAVLPAVATWFAQHPDLIQTANQLGQGPGVSLPVATTGKTLANAVGSKATAEAVIKVTKGRAPLSSLSDEVRSAAAAFYRDAAERVRGKLQDAAADFNRARANFLEGKIKEAPGDLIDFIAKTKRPGE